MKTTERAPAAATELAAEALIEQARRRRRRRHWVIALAAAAVPAVILAVLAGAGRGTRDRPGRPPGRPPVAGAARELGARGGEKARAGVFSMTAAKGSLGV